MGNIKTESVYCLVVDIINSTQILLEYNTEIRNLFNIALSKVLSPFITNLDLEDSLIKFTGDGWVISISDSSKIINLVCLAILLKNKFNSEIEKLADIKFYREWNLQFGLAYGNDIRIESNGQSDFVGDSIRRATRISTLCHPNEIITDSTIYSVILRDFETESIKIDRRIKEFNINKIEEDIQLIFSVKEPKISKLRNSHIMLYLFDQIGIEIEKESIINRVKSEADNRDLSIEEQGNIDQTSIYLSAIGRNNDSEIIDKKLRKVGYKRPVIYWNKKINILSNYESAKSVLDEMKVAGIQPDEVTYSTLMNKVDNYESAKFVLSEMKVAGIQPDEVTYSTLMNKVDNYESAKSVLDEMKVAGIQPNDVTFNTLMNKVDNYESAKSVLDEMKVAGIQPDEVTFNTLMNKVDNYESAKSVLDEMKVAGIQPDEVTFNTLMNKVDNYESAKSVLDEMKVAGIQPDEVTYSTLMNKADNYESAKSVLDEMKAAGIQPNLLTYCTLFSKGINNYTIEDVHKWYLSETYNPSSALEPLIKKLFYEKRFRDAYYLILNYPHLESARKIVTRHLALSLSMYDYFKGKVFYEKNINYALGIAYFDIGKSNKAISHLKNALSHAVAEKRREHIKNMLMEIELKSHQST